MIIEKKVKRFLLSFIGILLITGLSFLFLNRQKEGNKERILNNKIEADVVIEQFHLSQTEKGKIKWELKAESAELYRGEKRAVLKKIELRFRETEGNVAGDTIILKGEEGILNTETKDITLRGKTKNVEVITDKGYTFSVPNLRWEEATRRILSDDEVTLIGPHIEVRGRGILVNPDLQQIQVLSNVRTVFRRQKV